METDGKARSARLRRRRGYQWEDLLAKRFNGVEGWNAFRLGSPSTALPDILAVNNNMRSMFVIEAKSGANTSLSVPPYQIERCQKWCSVFGIYDTRQVVLAFKFLSKKRLGSGKYRSRELREYYKVWDAATKPAELVCLYDGRTYTLKDQMRTDIVLDDCAMPFQ